MTKLAVFVLKAVCTLAWRSGVDLTSCRCGRWRGLDGGEGLSRAGKEAEFARLMPGWSGQMCQGQKHAGM